MDKREYTSKGGSCRSAVRAHFMMRRSSHKFGSSTTAEQVAVKWDGHGKVVIITGCNTGLGKETARVLAARGAEIIMAVRDVERGEQAAASIRSQHPKAKLTVMHCDLASLASVRTFTETFKQLQKPCHILLANAGVMACPFGRTADGHELQFGINHLGHFALVQQLMPVLRDTAEGCGEPGRVVVLSSAAHFTTYPSKKGGPVRLQSLDSEYGYHPYHAYAQSKLCNLLFVRELHERLAAEGAPVTVVTCHPGVIKTDLVRHINEAVSPLLRRIVEAAFAWAFKSVEQGAATPVYLCTSPDIQGGEYYQNCAIGPASPASLDANLGSKLWALSEELMWAVPFGVPGKGPAGQLAGTVLCSTSVPGSSESEPERVHFDLV